MLTNLFNLVTWSSDVDSKTVPEHVVDSDDVLLLDVLHITHDSGTHLHPHPASVGQHQAVVVGQHLALLEHCNTHPQV